MRTVYPLDFLHILIYQALHTLWHNVTSHNAPSINRITNS